jgi:hypothetical protein
MRDRERKKRNLFVITSILFWVACLWNSILQINEYEGLWGGVVVVEWCEIIYGSNEDMKILTVWMGVKNGHKLCLCFNSERHSSHSTLLPNILHICSSQLKKQAIWQIVSLNDSSSKSNQLSCPLIAVLLVFLEFICADFLCRVECWIVS